MDPSSPTRYNVLGVGISALTLNQARDLVIGSRGTMRQGYICLCTVHGVSEARSDPGFRRILNESFLTTPDGMPLVWLGRRKPDRLLTAKGGTKPSSVERVYGPDLLLAVCAAGRAVGLRHYFYGGAPGVAELLAAKLTERFPGLEVAGTGMPPFRALKPAEIAALHADITRLRPDVIWVGMGTPKQERFMAEHWKSLDAGLLIGVGAAFDFHSGRVRQAPRWIQQSGFEWLFRICTEPRRLGPRYLKTNPLFIARIVGQRLGLVRYPLDS